MVCSGEEIASVLDRILHPPHTMFIHTHTHTHTRARARAREILTGEAELLADGAALESEHLDLRRVVDAHVERGALDMLPLVQDRDVPVTCGQIEPELIRPGSSGTGSVELCVRASLSSRQWDKRARD